ncbi:hypothetical protein CROQUDRAFT_27137, partial [Cronartium quercuum f. sp. fusiforme G11]
LQKVFQKHWDHGLFASAAKCAFYQTEVSFLDFNISSTGLCMDPPQLDTILKWPFPTNLAHLPCFLGFTNFYR